MAAGRLFLLTKYVGAVHPEHVQGRIGHKGVLGCVGWSLFLN